LPIHDCDTLSLDPGLPFHIHLFQPQNDPAQDGYAHRHTFYSIQYVTGGKGAYVIDFTSYPIAPHTIYFVSPKRS